MSRKSEVYYYTNFILFGILYQEIITVDDFTNMLGQICAEKQIAFSLLTQLGGYAHNKGYTTETSLRIVIIGADENEITILGERLKKKVNAGLTGHTGR